MTPSEIIAQSKRKKFLSEGDPAIRAFIESQTKDMTQKMLDEARPKIETEARIAIQAEIERLTKDVQKGDKGDTPVVGIDFKQPQDGKDYILTEADKKSIASTIKVPIVTKVIEKTEVIKERPIITNNVKEVAKYESPEQISAKLNTLTESVDFNVIRGLKNWMNNLQRLVKEQHNGGSGASGGGMGNTIHESISVNASSTYIETSNNIAANGFAIWAYYQGELIARGSAYNMIGPRRLNLLFTPENNTVIDVIYIRT